MDETAKVLLAALLGFIVAIVTEPIKVWIQSLIKREQLRLGLYKELYSNYDYLYNETEYKTSHQHGAKYMLANEYFKYVKENEITEFYKLEEATLINLFYKPVNLLIEAQDKPYEDAMGRVIEAFINSFHNKVVFGQLNHRILRKVMYKTDKKKLLGHLFWIFYWRPHRESVKNNLSN